MMVTATALAAYEYCARKFYLTKVLRLVEPPKEPMIKGSIKHKAIEDINSCEKRIVCSIKPGTEFENIKQQYEKVAYESLIKGIRQHNLLDKSKLFKEAWALVLPVIENRSLNVYSYMHKHNLAGEELWNALIPKIRGEVPAYDSELGLNGRVDEVRNYSKHTVILEIKTGSCPKEGVWPGHRLQMGAYMMIFRNKGLSQGIIFYIDHNEYRKVVLNPFLEDLVLNTRDKVIDIIVNKTVPKKTTHENKCRQCDLREQCESL